MIFNRPVSADILTKSPAREIKQLAGNERTFHVLTNKEERIYLMACPQPLEDVAAIMLETAMRPSEIYKLKPQNVFLEKQFPQIENGKTKSSNRKVRLPDKAADILCRRPEAFKGITFFRELPI
jgi:integrase